MTKGDNLKVLLLDDDQDICSIFKDMLSEEGYELDFAYDGDMGIEMLKAKRYDIVVSDLTMPSISGLEVARWVKLHFPETGVFLLTGWSIQTDMMQITSAGVDSLISKPFKFSDVLDAINNYVNQRANR